MQIFASSLAFALLPLFLPPDRTQSHTYAYKRRMQLCII